MKKIRLGDIIIPPAIDEIEIFDAYDKAVKYLLSIFVAVIIIIKIITIHQ